jgi:putative ABC transport system permease protein
MTALLVRGFRSEIYRVPLSILPSGFAFAGLVILAATAVSGLLAATAVSGLLVRRRLDRLDLVSVLKTRE